MIKKDNNRRDFLKKMFTLSIFTASCPHLLMGKLEPKILDDGGSISGIYELDTEIYKDLKELYKTIRIDVPKKDGGAPIRVMLTRIDRSVDGSYLAVFNEKCPHDGQKVFDIDIVQKLFVCSGHKTIFSSRGGYLDGPATQDLEVFQFDWNGTERFIKILFPFYLLVQGVGDSTLFYLKNNYPNPFNEKTTLEYGLENDSFVELEIKDTLGRSVKTVKSGYLNAGHYTNEIITNDMPKGLLICTLKINGQEKTSIKMIKQ